MPMTAFVLACVLSLTAFAQQDPFQQHGKLLVDAIRKCDVGRVRAIYRTPYLSDTDGVNITSIQRVFFIDELLGFPCTDEAQFTEISELILSNGARKSGKSHADVSHRVLEVGNSRPKFSAARIVRLFQSHGWFDPKEIPYIPRFFDPETLQILLKGGFDPNKFDSNGTNLTIFQLYKSPDYLRYLVQNARIVVDQPNKFKVRAIELLHMNFCPGAPELFQSFSSTTTWPGAEATEKILLDAGAKPPVLSGFDNCLCPNRRGNRVCQVC